MDAAARQASALISDKLQTRTLRCQQTPDILVNCKIVISLTLQTPDILLNCKIIISFKMRTPDILVNCIFQNVTIWRNCKTFNIAEECIFLD